MFLNPRDRWARLLHCEEPQGPLAIEDLARVLEARRALRQEAPDGGFAADHWLRRVAPLRLRESAHWPGLPGLRERLERGLGDVADVDDRVAERAEEEVAEVLNLRDRILLRVRALEELLGGEVASEVRAELESFDGQLMAERSRLAEVQWLAPEAPWREGSIWMVIGGAAAPPRAGKRSPRLGLPGVPVVGAASFAPFVAMSPRSPRSPSLDDPSELDPHPELSDTLGPDQELEEYLLGLLSPSRAGAVEAALRKDRRLRRRYEELRANICRDDERGTGEAES